MALNQFYTWAAAPGANAVTNSAFYGLTTLRAEGFQPGIASSEQMNTVLRQTTTAVAGVAAFINMAGVDAIDNGDPISFRDALTAAVLYAVRNATPVGTVITSYRTTPPEGYLAASGGTYLRASYPALYAAALADGLVVAEAAWSSNQAKFSSGDGFTTFRIPDLRGLHIRFSDGGRGVDMGRTHTSYQSDQFPAHTHDYRQGTSVGFATTSGGGEQNMARTWTDSGQTGVAGTGSEVRVKNIALNPYIKY